MNLVLAMPLCALCGTVATPLNFCFGCQCYVCDFCTGGDDALPIGAHTLEIHLAAALAAQPKIAIA